MVNIQKKNRDKSDVILAILRQGLIYRKKYGIIHGCVLKAYRKWCIIFRKSSFIFFEKRPLLRQILNWVVEHLKKRANASKRAMTELFSNSTDKFKQTTEVSSRSGDKRDALKKELFGVELHDSTVKSSEAQGALQKDSLHTSAVQKSATPAASAAIQSLSAEAVQKGTLSAQADTSATNALQGPRVERKIVQIPDTSPVRTRTATISAVPPVRAKTASIPVTSPTKTEEVRKNEKNKKAKAVKRWMIAVVCFVFVAAVGTVGAFILLNGKELPVPADISAGVEVSLAPPALLSQDATAVLTQERYSVTFSFYESPDITCTTPEITVGELIDKLGIEVTENNRMYVSLDDVIAEDTKLAIDTISYTTVTEAEAIAYETVYKDVRTIPKGTSSVSVKGVNGEKENTYKCTLVNGVEESRSLIDERITKKPTSRVITRGVGGTINYGGTTYSYSHYIDVKATVYNIVGTTATGLPTSTGVMAVDPRVIPLRSNCIVTGGSGDYGFRIAADVGGGIKGNIIDLWYPAGTFPGGFGFKPTRVYILD